MGKVAGGIAGEPNDLGIVAVVGPPMRRRRRCSWRIEPKRNRSAPSSALSDQLEQMQAARNALAESGNALGASLAKIDAAGGTRARVACLPARGCRSSSS